MGLLPLEFTDCQTDSPYFRDNLSAHEKELDRTSQAVKGLIKDIKDLLIAAKTLSKAQRTLASSLSTFSFECIGTCQTDDEMMIAGSLKEFGRLLCMIEDERDRMLDSAQSIFIEPLDTFRSKQLGGAKEEKKKFDKETVKFYQQLERHLSLSTKKTENLKESDASLELEQSSFIKTSLDYVLKLQEVHESKKFEIVERILSFMYRWFTFYHQGHEVANEFKSFTNDLQMRLQRTRESFEATKVEAEQLRNKLINLPKLSDPGSLNKMYTRQGYLYLMEKKALGTTWVKHFCLYQKETKRLAMIGYSHTTSKIISSDNVQVKKCIRRSPDSIDKRFCFDIVIQDRPGVTTFQAMSEEDYNRWLDAMDGKEATAFAPLGRSLRAEECSLDETGFSFVTQCIKSIEGKGLHDQGLYRLVGVTSKVNKLLSAALDPNRKDKMNLENEEIKTITSALKTYFRNLPQPLMTFKLHQAFLAAAKQENKSNRVQSIHSLVHYLPATNRRMLELLISHLHKVSQQADKNLMTVSNLGVCFGPTLLRPEEETMAAIMDIKFCNVTVRVLIENYERIFPSNPVEDSQRQHTIMNNHHPPPAQSPRDHREQQFVPPQQLTAKGPGGVNLQLNLRPNTTSYWAGVEQGPPPPRGNALPTTVLSHPAYSPPSYAQTNNVPSPANALPASISPARMQHRNSPTYFANPMWQAPENLSNIEPEKYLHKTYAFQQPVAVVGYPSEPPGVGYAGAPVGRPSPALHSRSTFHAHMAVSTPTNVTIVGKKVRTLYACMGDNDLELSFKPNEIIYDVRPSKENGWLEGCLNGRVGLVPVNYVEYIP